VSDQTTLAACPFCGGNNISAGEVAGQGLVNDDCTQTACMDCGALGPEAPLDGGPDYGDELSSAAWNRRASANGDVSAYIASLVAERDELREALTGLLSLLDAGIESASVSAFLTPIDAARKALSAKEPT
jgi:hypothetical protein